MSRNGIVVKLAEIETVSVCIANGTVSYATIRYLGVNPLCVKVIG